jgi:hypothetical protein
MVVAFGKKFLEDKHIWFLGEVLNHFNTYFDGQSLVISPMITISNVKFLDVEATI